MIYFCHKEGMLASVSFVADLQDHYFGYFSCFVRGAVHIFNLSWFLQKLCL